MIEDQGGRGESAHCAANVIVVEQHDLREMESGLVTSAALPAAGARGR